MDGIPMPFAKGKQQKHIVNTGWGRSLSQLPLAARQKLQPTSRVAICQFVILILPKTTTAPFIHCSCPYFTTNQSK